MSITQQKKSRTTMLLVLIAFALPVVLAKLALTQQWFNYGVTNKGTLVENGLTLEKLGLAQKDFEKTWLIIYSLPKLCDQQCEQTLLSVHNTYVALGKEKPRVKHVALLQGTLSEKQRTRLQQKQWTIASASNETINELKKSQVLIVDTLGNVVLSHQPPTDVNEQAMFGKEILADLKKLLKYSRIG
jgi:hypothetical protein